MNWIDLLAVYWFSIKLMLYLAGLIILISSLDDLFIDLVYWTNQIWKKLTRHTGTQLSQQALDAVPQQPIAIMVPAWQESSVIGKMAELAAKRFDYHNFHIFIGTYPNDEATQQEVDKITSSYANVHKVVCRDPGPTTKADCVNNIVASILQFERKNDLSFECFVFHDAEDVVHAQELKLFNFWVREYDLIQLPVFPLLRPWHWFTAGHYNDEFGEVHSKDLPVRQLLAGNVPSAGVGTGFSRKAIISMMKNQHGHVFNINSLTEDYDVSVQLYLKGFKQIFVLQQTEQSHWWKRDYVAIREYFPHAFSHAVRQKSRWIVGIVFQGWKNLGWQGSLAMRYMLFRDRKAVLTNPVNVIAYFIALNVLTMTTIHVIFEDAVTFPSLIYDDSWLMTLVFINGFILLNRLVQRFIFVSKLFGLLHGILALPRAVWANVINFLAFLRALDQVRNANRQGKSVVWDKTAHEFPDLDDLK